MSCCRSAPQGTTRTVGARKKTDAAKNQNNQWVVVYRASGQLVESEYTGGNSQYLAAAKEAGMNRGRVWPKAMWLDEKKKLKKRGGSA